MAANATPDQGPPDHGGNLPPLPGGNQPINEPHERGGPPHGNCQGATKGPDPAHPDVQPWRTHQPDAVECC
eukprot:4118542-Heterocapsa_arctica.AAC.1